VGKKIIRLTMIFIVLLLFGCSKNEATSNGKVVLKLGIWGSSPEETKLMDRQIELFEKLNPDITVRKEIAVGDMNEWLQLNVAAGTAPDVCYVDVMLAKDYINYNAFKQLNDYYSPEDLKEYFPSLLEGFTVDGKVYGIPKDFNTIVMYYNKDMFKTAGIETIPQNWKELDSTCKKLQTAGKQGKLGKDFKYPMSFVMEWNRVAPFVLQNGGHTYKDGKLSINSKEVAGGVDFVFDLMKKEYLAEQNKWEDEVTEQFSEMVRLQSCILVGGRFHI